MTSLPHSGVRLSWNPRTWTRSLHDQAVANARSACTECSRRRVEREEVALYLTTREASPAVVARHLG